MVAQEQEASPEHTRRSDRVQISIPIDAIGTDFHRGHPFCEKGVTSAVSRHGASIILSYSLAIDQELTIRCVATRKEAEARVVGLVSEPGKEFIYGITFLDDRANIWGIEFPTLPVTDGGLGRILLACSRCRAQKVFHLNEVEIQVFERTETIERFCMSCSATTSWKRLASEVSGETPLPKEIQTPKPDSPPLRVANRRKHGRLQTNVPACVRQPGLPEEIVRCENLSRSGLRLRTSKRYQKGAGVEVSIPYAPGTGNIFVPAQIIRVEDCGTFFRVGLAYALGTAAKKGSAYSGSAVLPDKTKE